MKLGAFEGKQTFELGTGQELTPVPDGYMIYKSTTEKVHYLNPTASILYELCGAGYSIERMGGFLKQALRARVRAARHGARGSCVARR